MDNIQHLVVDASPFINQSIDLNMPSIVTTSGTIKELRDRKAQQLVLQYPIKTKEASREALLFVIEFSKKTGDYQSLSKNDLDVLALTLELEWNTVGRDHLRNIPKNMLDNSPSTANKTIQAEGNGPDGELVVVAKKKKKRCRKKALVASADSTESKLAVDFSNDVRDSESNVADKSKDNIEYEEKLVAPSNNLGPRLKISSFIGTDSIQDTVIPQDELSDSDGGDWISPSSLKPQTQKIQANQQNIKVACITNDFAMQVFIFDENVLLQIGLNLLSTDGMRIKTLRTWVMRCHACYTINLKNETQFCSKCGNNTLLRIAVSVVNGEMKVHLKHDYKYNLRGSVYSIPAPKGGRQRDMVLRGDQKEYLKAIEAKKRLEKLSLKDEDCEGFGRRAEVPVPVVGYGKRNINAVTRGRRRK